MDMPRRKRIRLREYDYAQNGAYFVTICAKDKACLLGKIVGQGLCPCCIFGASDTQCGNVGQGLCPCCIPEAIDTQYGDVGQRLCSCHLSPMGEIVQKEIERIPMRFANVCVDKYVIMPNHVHMILILSGRLEEDSGQGKRIGDIVGAMKSVSTKVANAEDNAPGRKNMAVSILRPYHPR